MPLSVIWAAKAIYSTNVLRIWKILHPALLWGRLDGISGLSEAITLKPVEQATHIIETTDSRHPSHCYPISNHPRHAYETCEATDQVLNFNQRNKGSTCFVRAAVPKKIAGSEMDTTAESKASSKLGRKGDPRMHRAVAARLANPDISLFEALCVGGFEYPANDDASVVDTEKVTLGQRKNQLSRRLRLARKQHYPSKDSDSVTSSNDNSAFKSGNGKNGTDAQKELEKMMQQSRNSKASASNSMSALALKMKRECSSLGGLSDDEVETEAAVELPQEEPPRKRIAKFHPDFAPLFVPPSASVRNSYGGASGKSNSVEQPNFQNQQQGPKYGSNPNGNGNMGGINLGANTAFGAGMRGLSQQPSLFTQQISNVFTAQQAQQPRTSAVAISSLNSSAQSVGLTLEQLAMTLASNPTYLAKLIAEGNGGDALNKQQELALHLYETEAKALYSKCMLLAGIDPRMCQPISPTHLQFALKAWQAEGKRLHDLLGTRVPSEPPLDFGEENSDGKVNNGDHSKNNFERKNNDHDHDHDHEKHQCGSNTGGCDGTHVHRLDGQCGHKAIIHQPKDGSPHIDFVIGNKVECYHGIEVSDSLWRSKYKCKDVEESCSKKCVKNERRMSESFNRGDMFENAIPRIINLSEVNLQDPEWNYALDANGANDGASLVGLLKLGERSDDNMSAI